MRRLGLPVANPSLLRGLVSHEFDQALANLLEGRRAREANPSSPCTSEASESDTSSDSEREEEEKKKKEEESEREEDEDEEDEEKEEEKEERRSLKRINGGRGSEREAEEEVSFESVDYDDGGIFQDIYEDRDELEGRNVHGERNERAPSGMKGNGMRGQPVGGKKSTEETEERGGAQKRSTHHIGTQLEKERKKKRKTDACVLGKKYLIEGRVYTLLLKRQKGLYTFLDDDGAEVGMRVRDLHLKEVHGTPVEISPRSGGFSRQRSPERSEERNDISLNSGHNLIDNVNGHSKKKSNGAEGNDASEVEQKTPEQETISKLEKLESRYQPGNTYLIDGKEYVLMKVRTKGKYILRDEEGDIHSLAMKNLYKCQIHEGPPPKSQSVKVPRRKYRTRPKPDDDRPRYYSNLNNEPPREIKNGCLPGGKYLVNGMVVTLLENRSRGLYTFLKEDGEKWTKQISGLHLLKIKDPDDMPQSGPVPHAPATASESLSGMKRKRNSGIVIESNKNDVSDPIHIGVERDDYLGETQRKKRKRLTLPRNTSLSPKNNSEAEEEEEEGARDKNKLPTVKKVRVVKRPKSHESRSDQRNGEGKSKPVSNSSKKKQKHTIASSASVLIPSSGVDYIYNYKHLFLKYPRAGRRRKGPEVFRGCVYVDEMFEFYLDKDRPRIDVERLKAVGLTAAEARARKSNGNHIFLKRNVRKTLARPSPPTLYESPQLHF